MNPTVKTRSCNFVKNLVLIHRNHSQKESQCYSKVCMLLMNGKRKLDKISQLQRNQEKLNKKESELFLIINLMIIFLKKLEKLLKNILEKIPPNLMDLLKRIMLLKSLIKWKFKLTMQNLLKSIKMVLLLVYCGPKNTVQKL